MKDIQRWALPLFVMGSLLHGATNAKAESGIIECANGDAASMPLARQFSLLSWNVQKATARGWAGEFARLAVGHNLLLLQEAPGFLAPQLATQRGLSVQFAQGFLSRSGPTGVLSASTTGITRYCRMVATEPWLRTPKAGLATVHPIEGSDAGLLVINLHAINFSVGLSVYRSQLATLESLLNDHRGPAIVAGDFNTWRAGRQRILDTLMTRLGLGAIRFTPDVRTTFMGNALDHIYVRGLSVVAAGVTETEKSDHHALHTVLRVDH